MTQDTGKTEILTLSSKLPKASNRSTEVKVLKRGEYYLTPFTLDHLDEVRKGLSIENKKELYLLGYEDITTALVEMSQKSEAYLCRKNNEDFIMVGGLWFGEDQEWPQMFAMFSDKIKENFHAMARGSKMFVNYFDQWHDGLSMTISADYEFVLNWAVWLGFDPVGISETKYSKYVDFVRCNSVKKNVYDETSRPIMH
jgi:hypothetical protein